MIDAVALLQRMVEIESLSGQESAVAEYLVSWMTAHGFANAHVDAAGNAVGVRENPLADGSIHTELVLLGHMDTVPGNIPVRIEGDILHGRGTVDAKGPLATFAVAVAQAAVPPGVRLIVIGATEEEAATSKGARYAVKQYQPNFCIIGEPSGWDAVTLGYKGRLLMDYRRVQDMAHTAGPGESVAEPAVAWWLAMKAYSDHYNEDKTGLFNIIMPSIRDINTQTDGTSDIVEMRLGFRLPPGLDIDALEAYAVEAAGEAATVSFSGREVAYKGGRTTPLARAFHRALLTQGIRPRYKLKTGTSDMNVVGPVWNCPIVAYGPGDSQLDHTPIEHIAITEYLQAITVLQTVLETLTK